MYKCQTDEIMMDIEGIDCSLQVGDMGIFDHKGQKELIIGPEHKFFRGNHDNPLLCKEHPNYLGDWGYISEIELFWVAGGYSIDKDYRIIGIDWWDNEELGWEEFLEVIKIFGDSKPKIVVSHECPTDIKIHALTNISKLDLLSRTEAALQAMLDVHRPDIWIFGHHHKKIDQVLDGTRFVGLDEMIDGNLPNCCFEIPGVKWPKGY